LLPYALLGAILGLDVVSFPQAMVSRPIVAATLAGAVTGDIARGLIAGAVLEMMAMETLPIGASRYPEWATASVVGGALFAVNTSGARSGALVLAVVAAMLTAWAGGWSMYALRRLNGVWARRAQARLDAGSASTVVGLQLRGLTADLLRGALLTAIALAVFAPATRWAVARWTLGPELSRAVLLTLAVAVAGSAAWKLSHGARRASWYFVGGLVLGLALVVWR
jgi:PTS system mannose-specific IIC component